MLFADKLKEIALELVPEFDRLFEEIVSKQTHSGDLLLISENGLYNPDAHEWNNVDEKISPYMIGPDWIGHSETTHYEFIHDYRSQAIATIPHSEYLAQFEWTKEKKEEIEKMTGIESKSIQIEMLIYLKIWEADSFLKKLIQICKIVNSEPYDWHYTVPKMGRSKLINEKIIDRFDLNFPILSKYFKKAYIGQVRNSIAHSNFSIIGRNIHLNNANPNASYPQLNGLKFDEWIDVFHCTMVIYNELIRLFNKTKQHYKFIAQKQNGEVEIRINRTDPEIRTDFRHLYHTQLTDQHQRWSWKSMNLSTK